MPEPIAPLAVVVGCSAGGVQALSTLLEGLAANLPYPVIVVCHTGSEDSEMLRDVLALKSAVLVQEAQERHAPEPGIVYLAPAGYHLLLESDGRFALSVDARVCYSRPSIDVLFESAVAVHAQQLVGVVLTGANDDGAQGLKAIRNAGGLGIVQSPREAAAAAMPEAAIRIAGADHILPLADIAPFLNRLCRP
ncbi:MAG: chemotaxis protein CheB [Pseudomonadota bacterium]